LEQLSIRFPSPASRLAPDHEKFLSHGAGIYFPDFLSLQALHVPDFDRISTVQSSRLRTGSGQRYTFERKTPNVLIQHNAHVINYTRFVDGTCQMTRVTPPHSVERRNRWPVATGLRNFCTLSVLRMNDHWSLAMRDNYRSRRRSLRPIHSRRRCYMTHLSAPNLSHAS
jgi:hypothetical protein